MKRRARVAAAVLFGLAAQIAGPPVARAGTSDFVHRLYQEILGRTPVSSEVIVHAELIDSSPRPSTAGTVVTGFFASAEFRATATTPAAYVALLYRAILARSPDPAGEQVWVAAVIDRYNTLLPGFISSPEFQAIRAQTSSAALISRFYQVLLARAPGADEVAEWERILAMTGDVAALAKGFFNSPEYVDQPRTFASHVTTLYRAFLAREPGPTEVEAWVEVLVSELASLTQLFTGSGEFQAQLDGLFPPGAQPFLSSTDVDAIVRGAVASINATALVIAVVDRMGTPLAVFRQLDAPVTVAGNFGAAVDANEFAVSLARTGAFFSNNQAPLSSRTVRFISGIHFPPGIRNKANGALYGIENTNRGCSLNTTFNTDKTITPASALNGLPCTPFDRRGCGLGIATGKADLSDTNPGAVNGGGIPIFKDRVLVGGIGVTGVAPHLAEFAALVGSISGGTSFGPVIPDPGAVIIDGISLPFALQTTQPPGTVPAPGPFTPTFVLAPIASPLGNAGVPDGWLVGPRAGTSLTAAEVDQIVNQAVAQSNQTRAAIRLPLGSTARMMIAVADLDGSLLGLFRMSDATVFSIDVSVAKARNVVYLSGGARAPGELPGVPLGTAVTNRTISFGAQPLFPPGIDNSAPGPFFGLYLNDVALPCAQGAQAPNANQSGIVFFPGSTPLWKNGQMVGGLGVSGDGVEQDDLVSAAGATNFAPPVAVRADRVFVGGIRLPYFKFPRNPGEL